ncbi:glycoprotein 3-alpha-L-fucosyltransferase A-like protein [Dinothrombium tinctorium]|uniref:Fucosyltransferase n=1 Tax=Dinothrombium tinctorium TaxID=1965070 RepID=A0A443RMY0_9ACAR|nr:glycoprotein 3-alpha-L-fucosyltransferase A-like protein [Dinothrombium tinctorium]
MRRIRLRRAIFILFLVSFTSFLIFSAWINVSKHYAIRFILSGNENAKANRGEDGLRFYQLDSELQLPWFFANGSLRPNVKSSKYQNLTLFPNEASFHNDRIINQLMYIPSEYNEQKQKFKRILLNLDGGGWNLRDLNLGQSVFRECPVNSCELTADSDLAEMVDAIIFKDRFIMPKHRRPNYQIWILYLLECPLHTQSFHEADNFINWTATYRHDSDIVTPYEKFVYYGKNHLVNKTKRNYAKGKMKKVAWFVSNCGAKNNRLKYAKELKKYIDVDIFGSCGDKICSRSRQTNCFEMLRKSYKFYLAFENSNCRDYITEKFYVNALRNDVIPIAMGAHPGDYERSAPKNSYIHVDQFDSPQQLAEYLHLLDRNDTLYNAYFEWKDSGEFINTFFWCRLCALLHSNYKPKVYKHLNDWWANSMICKFREQNFKWEDHLKDAFPQ